MTEIVGMLHCLSAAEDDSLANALRSESVSAPVILPVPESLDPEP